MQPRLGILSVLQAAERDDCPFGEQTPLFEAIHRAALAHGMRAYVFAPQPWDAAEGKLQAHAFMPGPGKWVEVSAASPHVVYNRMPTRALEQSPECQALLQALRTCTGGRVFNREGFFSKLRVHSILQKNLPDGLHVPTTDAAADAEQVLRQAAMWGELWLKPDEGSLGRGVYRIIREPFGFTIESSDRASAENLETAKAVLQLRTLLPQQAYLIQQGIVRAEHQLRPFDLRVLLHKNGEGRFELTYQFARLANHGQIVTNVLAGGGGLPLKDLLSVSEQKTLQTVALAAARQLAVALPGPIGELGLDLALDRQRRFWLLEANSKPRLKMDPHDPLTPVIAGKIVAYADCLVKSQPKTKKAPRAATPPPAPSRDRRAGKDH